MLCRAYFSCHPVSLQGRFQEENRPSPPWPASRQPKSPTIISLDCFIPVKSYIFYKKSNSSAVHFILTFCISSWANLSPYILPGPCFCNLHLLKDFRADPHWIGLSLEQFLVSVSVSSTSSTTAPCDLHFHSALILLTLCGEMVKVLKCECHIRFVILCIIVFFLFVLFGYDNQF